MSTVIENVMAGYSSQSLSCTEPDSDSGDPIPTTTTSNTESDTVSASSPLD